MKYLLIIVFIVATTQVFAQPTPPGVNEIGAARTLMARYFNEMSKLVLVIGAIAGLVGGLRIYNNWQMGKKEIDSQVAGWFFACLFLSLMGIFIQALYNVPTNI